MIGSTRRSLIGGLAMTVVLAACGDGSEPTTTVTTTASPPTTAANPTTLDGAAAAYLNELSVEGLTNRGLCMYRESEFIAILDPEATGAAFDPLPSALGEMEAIADELAEQLDPQLTNISGLAAVPIEGWPRLPLAFTVTADDPFDPVEVLGAALEVEFNDVIVAVDAQPNFLMPYASHSYNWSPGEPVAPTSDAKPALADTAAETSGVMIWDTGFPTGQDTFNVAVAGSDKEEPAAIAQAYAGHGTFIASIARQALGSGSVRMATPFDDEDGLVYTDTFHSETSDVLGQLAGTSSQWVMSMSFGLYAQGCEPFEPLLLRANVRDIVEAGHFVVAAAGNDHVQADFFPAAFSREFDEVLAVASLASDTSSNLAGFSNCGDFVTHAVSGVGVVGIHPDWPDLSSTWSGTSFAAARVATEVAQTGGPPAGVTAPSCAQP